MSSFFTIPKSHKRKRNDANGTATPKKFRTGAPPIGARQKPTREARDESISGSESDLSRAGDEGYESADTDASGEPETAAEKRLRLAEEYLERVRLETEQDQEIGFDAEQIDRDLIAERLKEDVAEQKGKLYRFIAQGYDWQRPKGGFFSAEDAKTTTAVAIGGDFVFTATKDLKIMKWRIPDRLGRTDSKAQPGVARPELSKSQRRKLRAKRKQEEDNTTSLVLSTKGSHKKKRDKTYDHHVAPILSLACSPSGHLVVSGGADKRIIVWDAETLEPKRVFTQHRGAVTGLAFRRNANQMYSASADRTIKVWSMDELAYIETLFGHQDEVLDVGALGMERCVSVGGRDRTARYWKVVEETQLILRGGGAAAEKEAKKDRKRGPDATESKEERAEKRAKAAYGEGSLDRVAMIDDEMFVTGSDNGSLSLWSVQKKKPLHVVYLAHGLDPQMSLEEAFPDKEMGDREVPGPPLPRSITALAVLPYSDVVVSGSWEGLLRIWKVTEDKRKLQFVGTLGQDQSPGVGMGLTISSDGLVNGMAKKTVFEADSNGVETLASDGDVETNRLGRIEGTGEVIGDTEDASVANGFITGSVKLARQKQTFNLSGAINDLSIIERGGRGKETLVIAAALGKEPRLGRWSTFKGRNGACLFEVSKATLESNVGALNEDNDDEDESS